MLNAPLRLPRREVWICGREAIFPWDKLNILLSTSNSKRTGYSPPSVTLVQVSICYRGQRYQLLLAYAQDGCLVFSKAYLIILSSNYLLSSLCSIAGAGRNRIPCYLVIGWLSYLKVGLERLLRRVQVKRRNAGNHRR